MKLAMLLVIGIFLFSVGGCLYEQTYENMADLGIMVTEAEIVNLGAFASNLHFDVSGLLRNQTGITRVIAFAFVVCGFLYSETLCFMGNRIFCVCFSFAAISV